MDQQFNLDAPFTEKMVQLLSLKMLGKVLMVTGASAGFGVFMGLLMSSFEHNQSQVVDVSRNTKSQLKQHFFGYGRFLKRQSLHFAKFGLYISLIELPIEIVSVAPNRVFRSWVESMLEASSSVEVSLPS